MKHMATKSLITLVLFMATGPFNVSALVLGVPQVHQNRSNWCWAATSQAVLQYYGEYVSQEDIAAYATPGAYDSPTQLIDSSDPLHKSVVQILYNFGGISSYGYYFSVGRKDVYDWINMDQTPIFIRWGYEDGGHNLAIKGADYDNSYILWMSLMEPSRYDSSPFIRDYDWVSNAEGHYWTHTLHINTTPKDGISNKPVLSVDKELPIREQDIVVQTNPVLRDVVLSENPNWDGGHLKH